MNSRKQSALRAAASVPHFHYCDEVSVDALLEVRRQLNVAAGGPVNVTLLAFAVKALSLALALHPHVNARLSPDMSARVQFTCAPPSNEFSLEKSLRLESRQDLSTSVSPPNMQ